MKDAWNHFIISDQDRAPIIPLNVFMFTFMMLQQLQAVSCLVFYFYIFICFFQTVLVTFVHTFLECDSRPPCSFHVMFGPHLKSQQITGCSFDNQRVWRTLLFIFVTDTVPSTSCLFVVACLTVHPLSSRAASSSSTVLLHLREPHQPPLTLHECLSLLS